MDNVRHILPSLADPLLEGDATVFSTTPEEEAPKDRLTGQAIHPIEMVAPIVPLDQPAPSSCLIRLKKKGSTCWL